MRLTTGTLTVCAGANHLHIPVTVNSQTEILTMSKDDITVDFGSRAEAKEAAIARIRSALKEGAAALGKTVGQLTLPETRTILQGKDFYL